MYYINNEIGRINTAEAFCGNFLMIEDNLIIPYSNVVIQDTGFDDVFNLNMNSYLDFCYLIFKKINFISFDYEFKSQLYDKRIECYGGVHFLTDKYFEFWISYEDAKIILKQDYAFSKIPFPFSMGESKKLLFDNPAIRDLLEL